MRDIARYIIMVVLFFSCYAFGWADCYTNALSAVKEEIINFDEIEFMAVINIKFDCQEAFLIADLKKPYVGTNSKVNNIRDVANYLNFDLGDNSWIDILMPYCRNEASYWGPFCMGTDVHAAFSVLQDRELLKIMPAAIRLLGRKIANLKMTEKYDIIEELRGLFSVPSKAFLLGSFLGLDDNGVQVSRLLANLLYKNDYQTYAKILAATVQLQKVVTKSVGVFNNEFGTILFSTRTGKATLASLADVNHLKTYKLYSSVYLGCQMALNHEGFWATKNVAWLSGMSYELIKATRKTWQEVYDKGKTVSQLMQQGAVFGYRHCQL